MNFPFKVTAPLGLFKMQTKNLKRQVSLPCKLGQSAGWYTGIMILGVGDADGKLPWVDGESVNGFGAIGEGGWSLKTVAVVDAWS